MKCPNCEKELICGGIHDESDLIIVGNYQCVNVECEILEVIIKSPA